MDTEKIKNEVNEIQEKIKGFENQKFDFRFPEASKGGLILTGGIILGIIIGLIAYLTWWGIN
jgi:hypothetical protein